MRFSYMVKRDLEICKLFQQRFIYGDYKLKTLAKKAAKVSQETTDIMKTRAQPLTWSRLWGRIPSLVGTQKGVKLVRCLLKLVWDASCLARAILQASLCQACYSHNCLVSADLPTYVCLPTPFYSFSFFKPGGTRAYTRDAYTFWLDAKIVNADH